MASDGHVKLENFDNQDRRTNPINLKINDIENIFPNEVVNIKYPNNWSFDIIKEDGSLIEWNQKKGLTNYGKGYFGTPVQDIYKAPGLIQK